MEVDRGGASERASERKTDREMNYLGYSSVNDCPRFRN